MPAQACAPREFTAGTGLRALYEKVTTEALRLKG